MRNKILVSLKAKVFLPPSFYSVNGFDFEIWVAEKKNLFFALDHFQYNYCNPKKELGYSHSMILFFSPGINIIHFIHT